MAVALRVSSWHLVVCCCLPLFAALVGTTEYRHTIYGLHGTLSSPNYPRHYPLNTTVIWLIAVERSRTIELNFTDFHLEKNKKCIYDHVYIEETQMGAGSITKRYCGHTKPPNYKSLSNQIKLVFQSDPLSNVDIGFKATWRETGRSIIDQGVIPSQPINPSKSCIPTTVTLVEPCHQPAPLPVTVTVTAKPTTCICGTKTTTQTITITKTKTLQTQAIKATKSLHSSYVVKSSADVNNKDGGKKSNDNRSNKVEDTEECKPSSTSSLIDAEKVAAERDSSKSLVVSLGVVLAALFITNVFLLVLLCKRERGYSAISLHSLRRFMNGKRRPPSNTPDIYYSSYTRPTLRMVDGEIVVVPPGPPTITDSDLTSTILLETYRKDKRSQESDNIEESPELPFHMIPQGQITSTLTSGETDENTIASTRSEMLSEPENQDFC
ncbi:cubilin-like isoform X2 [Rhopilema esculentum]